MDFDLNSLTLEELNDLKKEVQKAITSYEERQKREARSKIEAQASAMGFKLEELFDVSEKKKRKPVAPKYQHPDIPETTWSGRGRKPKWVIEHLDAGGAMDELLIK